MSADRSYPGKLLLFGEYTILSGSRALAVPLSQWQGKLKTGAAQPDQDLLHLSKYLDENKFFSVESNERLRQEIESGMYFDSNIPRGYGAGSSGALCAAIYDRFFATGDHDIAKIRQSLATMEGYFHGTSSGMDPLVSLMNTPVLREAGNYHLIPELTCPPSLQIFLIDSGMPRSTDHLVKLYMQWTSSQENFLINCIRPLVQSVDHAISFFIDVHLPAFWDYLKLISNLQFHHFKPMITDSLSAVWKSTLDHPNVAIKLCGAGGGGYYLGFAQHGADMNALFARSRVTIVLP